VVLDASRKWYILQCSTSRIIMSDPGKFAALRIKKLVQRVRGSLILHRDS
jgi:hypothetical protein